MHDTMEVSGNEQTLAALQEAREADQFLILNEDEEDVAPAWKCHFRSDSIPMMQRIRSLPYFLDAEIEVLEGGGGGEDGLWTSCSSLLRRRRPASNDDQDECLIFNASRCSMSMSGRASPPPSLPTSTPTPPKPRSPPQVQQQLQHRQDATTKRSPSRVEKAVNRRIHAIMFQEEGCFDSNTNSKKYHTDVCTLEPDEIIPGLKLGRGSFADVKEIRTFSFPPKEQRDKADDSSLQKRRSMAESCLAPTTGKARYAIKQLRRDLIVAPRAAAAAARKDKDDDERCNRFWAGVTDLAVESKILSQLEHPHIIKLHGVAKKKSVLADEDPFQASQDFFLVLDRLYDTLFTRIHGVWKYHLEQEPHPFKARLTGRFDKARRESNRFLSSRLTVARDLASAIAYLHEKRLSHRDIKPDNIGFDASNRVKLFDFGLARYLPLSSSSSTHDDGNADKETFPQLTQMVGSLRYMAPEVMLGMPYNQGCDVYSFSIVLWEILTCQQGYSTFSKADSFVHHIGQKHVRPLLLRGGSRHSRKVFAHSKACQDMLRKGWHADLTCRASMREMQSQLEAELQRVQEDYETRVSRPEKTGLLKNKRLGQQLRALNLIKSKAFPHAAMDTSRTFRGEDEESVVWI